MAPFRLSRHAREHIGFVRAAQSVMIRCSSRVLCWNAGRGVCRLLEAAEVAAATRIPTRSRADFG